MSEETLNMTSGGSYQIKMLKATNWMPWKHWILVVPHDLGLELYIAKDAAPPGFDNPQTLMKDEEVASKKWHEGDAKARIVGL